ncbi:hypothetical protein H6F78_00175 [Coleofasciculus sp. FACHB-64]|uniref:hypothetical protein n=1 Tax=Cyanophyceae TaxID=3028117 RepID=UPI001683DA45|nr:MULTISPECIES: hypothetical protein [unclassified Coleofasciculus]MBD1840874.1 hypothetical protein [Coleofasciculus sp. FACHB-501]MBD2044063.1 hypothetical protein [Coleofasciculus sp. FACHB-64]
MQDLREIKRDKIASLPSRTSSPNPLDLNFDFEAIILISSQLGRVSGKSQWCNRAKQIYL